MNSFSGSPLQKTKNYQDPESLVKVNSLFLTRVSFLFLFSLLILTEVAAQTDYTLRVRKSPTPIQLDGHLDEKAWQDADLAADFFQNFPYDTSFSTLKTEVRVCFDDHFLYIGAVNYQDPATYLVSTLRRDFDFLLADEFQVNIDPFNDKLNGFHFAISPFNVQKEGLIDNGNSLNTFWDNKWYSQVVNTDSFWSVEIAIPFNTLRYKKVAQGASWRINFTRVGINQNEASNWFPVPRQFELHALAFAGQLIWAEAPPEPGLNASVIPYLIGGMSRDFELDLPNEFTGNAGFDAKVAITPSLNLDLTFNPDFSQVDVDRQITNLSRFELFFPERRQFFLENEDLFGKFGFPDSRPFFSRRIGLAFGKVRQMTNSGQTIEVNRSLNVPILGGARLSGKLNPNWRVGLLNMFTGERPELELDPANYSVGVIQRRIQDRSVINAFFTNKENFNTLPQGGIRLDQNGYNRVAGVEYNFYSEDNKWESELFYHRSFSDGDNRDAQAAGVFLGRFTRNWRVFMGGQYIGRDYRADMGFVPRRGYVTTFPGIIYNHFPRNPKRARKLNFFQIGFENDLTFNAPDYRLTDRRHEFFFGWEFPGNENLYVSLNNEYTYLFFSFDPTNSGGVELPEDTDYSYSSASISYESDRRYPFYFELDVSAGQYFNGTFYSGSAELNLRIQPYGILALSAEYVDISLPQPYNSANFWLIGPRAELAFSRTLFFSTFLQYNTQINNINLNSRLQWRFKPVSDLFLVYTDNYFSEGFFADSKAKNRALVLKVTYWLNI